jgi:hypothetical protein
MNSKEKTFIGILAGATVICVGGLFVFAGKGTSRVETATEQFTTLSEEINKMQNLPLYPTAQNLTNKEKELAAYQANANQLAEKLQAMRPAQINNTDPQTFTNTLVKTAEETMKAYEAAGLTVEGETGPLPRGFYLGFENYTSTPAQQGATGILTYELAAISEVHSILAAAKPVKLLNFMREPLPEEKNQPYTPTTGVPYRALPFEISFAGPESTMRNFINGLQTSKSHFFVIRSIRVMNEKPTGPKASDVEFEVKAPKAADGAVGGGAFDGFDNLIAPDAAPVPEGAPAVAEPPKPKEEPKGDSSRILKQVLGAENIQVFLRVDILLFDAPAAPKP